MIYFTTETFLKHNGMITDNVDASDFTPLVQFAAKAFLKKQIGSYFFDDLLTKYNAQTLSPNEMELVEKMQYAIAFRATAQAGVSLTYQLKNKGYQTQSGDNSDAVEDGVVWKMYDHYIQQSILFENEIKEYLLLNKALYPIFTDVANNDSIIRNNECNAGGSNFNEGVGLIII